MACGCTDTPQGHGACQGENHLYVDPSGLADQRMDLGCGLRVRDGARTCCFFFPESAAQRGKWPSVTTPLVHNYRSACSGDKLR